MHSVWPVTVIACRYGGTYEGGKFAAFNDHPENIRMALADDIACSTFFEVYGNLKPIGRGATPQEAYDDLVQQVKS